MQPPKIDLHHASRRAVVICGMVLFVFMSSAYCEAEISCGFRGAPPCVRLSQPYRCLNPLKMTLFPFLSCVTDVHTCDPGLQYDDATKTCRLPPSKLAEITVRAVDFMDETTHVTDGFWARLAVDPDKVVSPSFEGFNTVAGACGGPSEEFPHPLMPVMTWALQYGTRLTVNSNFFALPAKEYYVLPSRHYFSACSFIQGLAVSYGATYAKSDNYFHSLIFLNDEGVRRFSVKAMIISPADVAAYQPYILHAASGVRLLEDGNIPKFDPQFVPDAFVARTAVGLTEDNSTLIVVVVQPGKANPKGTRLAAFAQYLKTLGAYNAINFDGGGSSTFVYDDGAGTRKESLPGDIIFSFTGYRPVPAVLGFR